MEYIGTGGARVVFKDGDKVLKYPVSKAALYENETEAARYSTDADPRLAFCLLRDDGILEMEYLDDATFEYACWQDGVQCELYDISDRRVQPREIICDHNCKSCEHNVVKDYSKWADLAEVCGADKRVQCGFDNDGNLKVYDYGSESVDELKTRRETFGFYDECAPVLLKWIENGNKPEDFSDWALGHKDELPKREKAPNRNKWQNKRTRERVCDGRITWK